MHGAGYARRQAVTKGRRSLGFRVMEAGLEAHLCAPYGLLPLMSAPNFSSYRQFQSELEHILRHKWLVSEREGQDVGFERALNEWALNHRAQWRREQNKLQVETNTPPKKAK